MTEKKKYGMIGVDPDVKDAYVNFCEENGLKQNRGVLTLVKFARGNMGDQGLL